MLLPFHESVQHFKRMRLQEAIDRPEAAKLKRLKLYNSSQAISRVCANKWVFHNLQARQS
jgi:hypothetical protein